LLEQLPGLDVLVLPVGGGGLLAGVAVAVKALKPDVRVIAVEPEAAASYSAAWAGGAVMRVSVAHTLADGLAVAQVGARAFAASSRLVDDVVRVSEGEIAAAILHLFEHGRTIAEGAGAVALAAVLAGKIDGLRDRTVGLPVCGSNIDPHNFAHALQVALDARRSGVEAVTAA
jgi:threonine dehydratase